jgi:hypothetical protein
VYKYIYTSGARQELHDFYEEKVSVSTKYASGSKIRIQNAGISTMTGLPVLNYKQKKIWGKFSSKIRKLKRENWYMILYEEMLRESLNEEIHKLLFIYEDVVPHGFLLKFFYLQTRNVMLPIGRG